MQTRAGAYTYIAARIAAGAFTSRDGSDFRTELEDAYGMTGHPKAAALYELAYEYGHSAGHAEVLTHYERLCELV